MANDSYYGLNASVWSTNYRRAKTIARQLETGNCMINDIFRNVSNPYLPFGGIKNSGIGSYHGKEGLINFSHTKSVMLNKNRRAREINWFPFGKEMYHDIEKFLSLYFADASLLHKFIGVPKQLLKILRRL
nr:aldehyde dehydrogenase family protein [Natranaerobius thermophilus]